jgi:predicted flap endonuclease-1-like 5' DNA nuclease
VIVVKDKVAPARVFVSPTGIRNDDLKIVEGIGPKIEGLLKRAGIEN